MDDLEFDFEESLPPTSSHQPPSKSQTQDGPGGRQANLPRNYRQTVCTYWLRGLCMKGDTCGFLHQFDPDRMPVCRNLLKFGTCKDADCPYKHTTDEIKECNMYKLGFCIYGPACRFKHTRQPAPVPDPETWEACKPREFRNITIVANQANEGVVELRERVRRNSYNRRLALTAGEGGGPGADQSLIVSENQYATGANAGRHTHDTGNATDFIDSSLLAAVGQKDLRYGF